MSSRQRNVIVAVAALALVLVAVLAVVVRRSNTSPRTRRTLPTNPVVTTSTVGRAAAATNAGGLHVTGVSFIGATGWAVGTEPCTTELTGSCAVVERTESYGETWSRVAAPQAPGQGSAGADSGVVTDVRFADRDNGWLFARDLWSTHDGGASWSPVTVGNPVVAVEAFGDEVLALVAHCGTGAGNCPAAMQPMQSPKGEDAWAPVETPPLPFTDEGQLVVYGASAYLTVFDPQTGGPRLFATGAGGRWEERALPCGRGTSNPLAASGDLELAYVCVNGDGAGQRAPQRVHTSADGGRTWTLVTDRAQSPYATSVAATGKGTFIAYTNDTVEVTRDAGKTYQEVLRCQGGQCGFVGFTDDDHGYAIADVLYRTADAGQTWTAVALP